MAAPIILRPDSEVYQSNIQLGDYTSINEEIPTEPGEIGTVGLTGGPLSTAQYVCGLQNPSRPYGPGLATCRFRGHLGSGLINVEVSLVNFATATVYARSGNIAQVSAYTNHEFQFDVADIPNWNTVSLSLYWTRFSGTARGSISWAEIELPPLPASGMLEMF